MAQIIFQRMQRARQDYDCNACEYIRAYPEVEEELSGPEKRALSRAKANGWKVKKGDLYIQYTVKLEGEMHTVKCIPEIHKICQRHELYTE